MDALSGLGNTFVSVISGVGVQRTGATYVCFNPSIITYSQTHIFFSAPPKNDATQWRVKSIIFHHFWSGAISAVTTCDGEKHEMS